MRVRSGVGGDSVALSDKKRLLKAKAKVVRQRCPLPTFKRWVKTKNKVADRYIYIYIYIQVFGQLVFFMGTEINNYINFQ